MVIIHLASTDVVVNKKICPSCNDIFAIATDSPLLKLMWDMEKFKSEFESHVSQCNPIKQRGL